MLLDGSLIPTQRRTGLPMRRRWSAKHKRHGLLVIGLTDLKGRLLWTSTARPARGSEITACRHDDLVGRLRAANLAAIADLGFVGLDDDMGDPAVITGYKKPKSKQLPPAKKLVNQLIAAERAVCEHAFPSQELARADQAPPRRALGHPARAGAAGPQPARDRPLSADLHRRQAPTTSTSTASSTHATPVTCTFRMNTTQCPVLCVRGLCPGCGPSTRLAPALHHCSRSITSPSNKRKSLSAGVDIGRRRGYGFSRSRDQQGPAETNCRAAVPQLQLAGRFGGGVSKPGLLQDGDGTGDRTGWPAVIRGRREQYRS
ncbi:transposase family protein [Streptomyces scopuliridis]|uniref:transposase family protein n=1 Tax=Streptomyces scopuliridis TaxID=452529 RepID=UPI0036C64EF4